MNLEEPSRLNATEAARLPCLPEQAIGQIAVELPGPPAVFAV